MRVVNIVHMKKLTKADRKEEVLLDFGGNEDFVELNLGDIQDVSNVHGYDVVKLGDV